MNTKQGIVKIVILLVIALLVLSYYGFDLRKTVESPNTQSNFTYAKDLVINFWHNYLERPVKFVWNIFITYIWGPAFDAFKRMGSGQPMDMQQQMTPPIPQQRAI